MILPFRAPNQEETCFLDDDAGLDIQIPAFITVKTLAKEGAEENKTAQWLNKTAPLIHRMSHDEAYREEVAKDIT